MMTMLTNNRIRGLKMSKSLKNFTTIRSILAGDDWTARSLRICFLLMPWQDGIEVTDQLMKAVIGWEGKLNNFFLKSLDLWKQSKANATTQNLGTADEQLLGYLARAKANVDTALRDSFDTSTVMRILSDLVTECNSAETLSDQTVISIAQWVTRIIAIFGLDPEGNLNNAERIGWASLEIPTAAQTHVHAASQLRDQVRKLDFSLTVDYTAIAKLADESVAAASADAGETSKPYAEVLQQFRTDIKALAAQESPKKDFLGLCDQLRDLHLWNLGIYLEDRIDPQPALVRPLDKMLIEARADREAASAAKAQAKLEKEARDAELAKEMRERAKINPRQMFRASDQYSEWDDDGIPLKDTAGKEVSKNQRKKLVKEWEKQRQRHDEWLASSSSS